MTAAAAAAAAAGCDALWFLRSLSCRTSLRCTGRHGWVNRSHINEILQHPERVTLEELLKEDDLLQEVAGRNEKLMKL